MSNESVEVPDRFELSNGGFADRRSCTSVQHLECAFAALATRNATVNHRSAPSSESKQSPLLSAAGLERLRIFNLAMASRRWLAEMQVRKWRRRRARTVWP
jgi:hypothetical protein